MHRDRDRAIICCKSMCKRICGPIVGTSNSHLIFGHWMGLSHQTPVETYVRMNHNMIRLLFFCWAWVAVVKWIHIFLFRTCNFRNMWACNVPLESYWKILSNGILHAPKVFYIALTKQKCKNCSCSATIDEVGQKNRNRFWLRFLGAKLSIIGRLVLETLVVGENAKLSL